MILFIVNAVLALYFFRHFVSVTFQTLEREARRHEKVVERYQIAIESLIDRLMTIKWEDFAAIKAIDDEQVGGQTLPGTTSDEEEGEAWQEGGQWGNASRLREKLRLLDEEEQLIDQDFDHEGNPRRGPVT
jgi:hypothetical protein